MKKLAMTMTTSTLRLFDKLEDCALALSATHTRHADAEAEDLDTATTRVLTQASDLRALLMADAAALCKRGFLKPSDLGRVKGLKGYDNTAQDLASIRSFLLPLWPAIRGKSAVTLADLNLITVLVAKLGCTGGVRKYGSPTLAFATDERARAFTLLVKTYTEVRRTIAYLRAAEGEIDSLMPMIWSRPRRGG
jgi:hypothetical protein